MHEGIGTPTGRDGNGVVCQHREGTTQIGVYFSQSAHEGIVLPVAAGGLLVSLPVNLDFQRGNGTQTLCQ
ncbi:hypothetical protein Barb7_02968 [Bacteroidales bacterium Barb7]|nr:hypothetical protein Barb7_02968 [Bacteroidales bacterium Barb7]